MAKKNETKRIVEAQLNIMGEIVYEEARVTSRVSKDVVRSDGTQHLGGSLRKSINYGVKSQRVKFSQLFYGKFQQPNELVESIKRHLPDTVKVISVNLVASLLNKR